MWERLLRLADTTPGPKLTRNQLCEIAMLRLDLADANAKLDRVREEATQSTEFEMADVIRSRVLAILDGPDQDLPAAAAGQQPCAREER